MFQDAAKQFYLVARGYTKQLGAEYPKTVDAFNRLKFCQGVQSNMIRMMWHFHPCSPTPLEAATRTPQPELAVED